MVIQSRLWLLKWQIMFLQRGELIPLQLDDKLAVVSQFKHTFVLDVISISFCWTCPRRTRFKHYSSCQLTFLDSTMPKGYDCTRIVWATILSTKCPISVNSAVLNMTCCTYMEVKFCPHSFTQLHVTSPPMAPKNLGQ